MSVRERAAAAAAVRVAPTPVVRRLVELACLAPSVHNTQPWTWRVTHDGVELYADRTRQLPVEDPDGRNLVISCGAALHELQFAAEALGWRAEVERLPDGATSDLLARVRLSRMKASPTAAEDLAALRARCTDRRRFTSWPVPDEQLEALAAEARKWRVSAQPVTDTAARFRIELMMLRAHELRTADASAQVEQHHWIGRSGVDGIPLEVLPSAADAASSPSSRFGPGALVETRSIVEGGDGVVVLGGPGDDPVCWLRTGEGLSALWLRATRTGQSVVPLSLPFEIEVVRREVEHRVLDDTFTPHVLARIGWQAIGRSELPRTPRRPVAEVLRA